MSVTSTSSVVAPTYSATRQNIDWAQSWENAAESWQNDPQGLLTNWKQYQEELRKRNAGNLIYSPGMWDNFPSILGRGSVNSPSPYVVGIYRAEVMELIKQNPQLLAEFVQRVGPSALSRALVFARNNPSVAYGAPSAAEFNNLSRRKDLLFDDLEAWIRNLAARQDGLVYTATGRNIIPGYVAPNIPLGVQRQPSVTSIGASVVDSTVSLLISLLFIVGVIVGGMYVWRRL